MCVYVLGVGGNLVAVQASRISTYLHMNDANLTPRRCPTPCIAFFGSCKSMARSRALNDDDDDDGVDDEICLSFLYFLSFLPAVNSRSARVLFLLVAPGHIVFLYTINSLRGGHTTLTPIFITFYLVAALLQVHMLCY